MEVIFSGSTTPLTDKPYSMSGRASPRQSRTWTKKVVVVLGEPGTLKSSAESVVGDIVVDAGGGEVRVCVAGLVAGGETGAVDVENLDDCV